jgi:hypothetical protein
MTDWITDRPPPKDGSAFLADVGWPWAVVAAWNRPENQFVYARLDIDLFMGIWDDTSFVNEYAQPKEITAWAALPAPPSLKTRITPPHE